MATDRLCCPCWPVDGLTTAFADWETNETVSDRVLMLPATSVACTLIVFEPIASATGQLNVPVCTLAETPLHVRVETPDNESDTVPATVIAEVATVAPFAGDVMLSAGGVLSMFRETVVLALFPALSIAVPEII